MVQQSLGTTLGTDQIVAARAVSERLGDDLWTMYREAFSDIGEHAIGTQVFERADFDRLLMDRDTYKLVGFESGVAVGMIVLTSNLALIPGVNVATLHDRYPDHASRDTIFYVPFAFVSAQAKSLRLFAKLVTSASQIAAVRDGVIVLDMCRYLESSGQARLVRRALRAFPDSSVDEIDAQVYYAATLPKPADAALAVGVDDIDLVIDVRDDPAAPAPGDSGRSGRDQ